MTVTEARDVINYNTCVLVSTQVAQPTVQSPKYRVNNTCNDHICINQVSNRSTIPYTALVHRLVVLLANRNVV